MENWYRIQAALLAAIVCAALAINVMLRSRRQVSLSRFAWFNLSLVAWFVVDALVIGEALTPRTAAGLRGLVGSMIPATMVAFFSAFVDSDDPASKVATALSRAVSIMLATAVLAIWIGADLFESLESHREAVWGLNIVLLAALAIALGVSVGLLYRRFRAAEIRSERTRLLYLTIASAAVMSFALFSYASGIGVAFLGYLIPAIYLFFLFQVVTLRRILDLFEFAGRFAILTGFAIVLSLIFALLVGWWRHDFGLFIFNTIIATAVILILLDPLRTFVEQRLGELIFREKFEFTKLTETIRRSLVNVIDVGALAEVLLRQLEASRQVTHASVYLRDEEGLAFTRLGFVGTAPTASLDAIVARPFLTRLSDDKIVTVELLEAKQAELVDRARVEEQGQLEVIDSTLASMDTLQAALAIAFESDNQLLGFLCVKDERLREAYGEDQVKALGALAAQATITIENSRLFDRIRERDRLAAVGEMAAGLAHEIRNPLGAIKGAAELLTEVDSSQRAAYLAIITEEVNRLDGVVSQFLTYSRPFKGQHEPIDVNHVLKRTLTLIEADDHTSTVAFEPAPNLPSVRADPEHLRQVTLNLARNAVEAMAAQGGGTLSITTALTWRAPTTTRGPSPPEQVAFVRIRFEDQGPGIPPEVMENLFIPFYTTKAAGTGLGLAICQRIVRGMGGTIEVSSKIGRGTTFAVHIPVAEASAFTTTVT